MEDATPTPALKFSFGMELASFVVASDVVTQSLETIVTQSLETIASVNISRSSSVASGCLRINVSVKSNCTIIAFVTSQFENIQELEGAVELVSSETLDKQKFPFINLLCYKNVPSISIHEAAACVFASAFGVLDALYTQCVDGSKLLIITGHSLGGSVASLFTLWLLGRLDPAKAKLPLCITFGAPLIGDDRLLKAVSQRSIWDSRFVHIVEELDPVPRFLAVTPSSLYKPFGTYLLASQSGCACFNDPESVIMLLKATHLAGLGSRGSSLEHYGRVMAHLKRNIVAKGVTGNEEWIICPQQVGIASQLEAIGISRSRSWHQNTDIRRLCGTLEKQELAVRINIAKKNAMDSVKRLNDMKIYMANLEWYIKKSQEEETGYYNRFKNYWTRREQEVTKYKTLITKYWKDIVAKAEQKPQREGSALCTLYIGSGTNYRRMVEPLDIAEYYRHNKHNGSGYTSNRPEHYTRLEEWLDDARVVEETRAPRMAASNLTEDSCFWARVEEATALCRSLSNGGPESLKRDLAAFELYVMWLLKTKTVSSDIFLKRSSFMQWWQEYKSLLREGDDSDFIGYMRSRQYENYK